mmetsp:Transcript_34028/g.84132  ORF Transcript_34028/g.84132 Transcript_34028/m.84132 type:complete len:106 (+) Transcript_34028:382-699(+)
MRLNQQSESDGTSHSYVHSRQTDTHESTIHLTSPQHSQSQTTSTQATRTTRNASHQSIVTTPATYVSCLLGRTMAGWLADPHRGTFASPTVSRHHYARQGTCLSG